MKLLQRIRDWAVGPGGWLADSNLDEQFARIDRELDELERQVRRLERTDYHQIRIEELEMPDA